MTETDFAYLAGLIDADGYIGIWRATKTKHKGEYQRFIRIVQVWSEPLVKLSLDYGAGVYRSSKTGGQHLYHATWTGEKAAKLASNLIPYSRLKKEQLVALVEFNSTYSERYFRHNIIPFEIAQRREQLWQEIHRLNGLNGGNGSITWKNLENNS